MIGSSPYIAPKKLNPSWILWPLYAVGFAITVWALLDAEITMVVAHGQWEIHEETALKIALYIWIPIVAITWITFHCLRSRRHRISQLQDNKKRQNKAEMATPRKLSD